jgi:hypothetical protein
MAWSRFDELTRRRVQQRYLEAFAEWKLGDGYRVPGEFVLMLAQKPIVQMER